MTDKIDCSLIKNTTLAAELDEKQCEVLASIARERSLESGEVLFSEDEEDSRLYVIVEGRLAVTQSLGRDRWDTLKLLNNGDMAGESGFLEGGPHTVTLRAVGQTRVIAIEREEFEALLDDHPRLVYMVMRAIIHYLRELTHRMNSEHAQMTQYISWEGYGSSGF